MLASVNGMLTFAGRPEWRAKFLKRQRAAFCDERRELRRADYVRPRQDRAPRKKAAPHPHNGDAVLHRHPRIRARLRHSRSRARGPRGAHAQRQMPPAYSSPPRFARKLLRYAAGLRITRGPIFTDRAGKPVSRHRVWYEMKKLGARAGVAASKAFPHNLRHLFARTYYALERDLSKLRGPARPQQRRDDAPLHNHRRRRTSAPARQNEACNVIPLMLSQADAGGAAAGKNMQFPRQTGYNNPNRRDF